MKKSTSIKLLLFFTTILTIFYILTRVNILDYEKPIPYSRIENITFENFRGLEFFRKSLYGNEQFAYVKTSIEYEFCNDSIKIESFFHPSSSYVYNKKVFSKDLLKHEMYHFKITELYTRISKHKISLLKNSSKKNIVDILDESNIEENNLQIKYDDDTFHSYVLGEQKKYEKKIDSLLYLYSKYSKPKIPINEN